MRKFSTAIIGGGPAGITAAISARRAGNRDVVICEKLPRIGKKILASGNGRCNLLNERCDESKYNPASRHLVASVFKKFGKDDIKVFFKSVGLEISSEADGRIFPATNQASSVLRALEMELTRLNAHVELDFKAENISHSKDGFTITSKSGKKLSCRSLILCGGGKSYPALGSDGSTHDLAARFGHGMVEPVPAAVPVVVKDPLCHLLQGQKVNAKAAAVIDGKRSSEASGEVLFTKYGLSGTSILDISEAISIAINRHRKSEVAVSVDLAPFLDENELHGELDRRIKSGWPNDDLLIGILPNKFGPALRDLLKARDADKIAVSVKGRRFKVLGTRGWNEAEFTAGGVDISGINEATLESKLKKGLYFAGEILDVTGNRGGYNLAWAWASGFVAGLTG